MRYNIFNKAHLPLKTALITGCITISEAIEQQAGLTTEALKKVDHMLSIFNEQVAYETLHIMPFVFEYEPSVCSNYRGEHEALTGLAKNLKYLLHSYDKQQKQQDKLRLLTSINESYNEFMLLNFNHMDEEEAVLNEILWRYYQDVTLCQIEEKTDILPHLLNGGRQNQGLRIATAA